jgi:hypothetical protein
LPRLRVSELRAKFAAVFGEPTPSHNKVWLGKRIAWRLQASPKATCLSAPESAPPNWSPMRTCVCPRHGPNKQLRTRD